MALEKIEVETGKVKVLDAEGKEVRMKTEFQYDFGANLSEATAKYGESVVFNLYKAKAVIQVQDLARNALVAGKSSSEAAELATKHKLGESTAVTKDLVSVSLNALEKMTAEERSAFIKTLMAKAKTLS
jgi:hypothetical protein